MLALWRRAFFIRQSHTCVIYLFYRHYISKFFWETYKDFGFGLVFGEVYLFRYFGYDIYLTRFGYDFDVVLAWTIDVVFYLTIIKQVFEDVIF